MHVVATAGHVDHGKSALVRALTGMEPDRWEEERRRGLTVDLGFAWTALDSGRQVAFVDVPGHERFVTNMLAGVGPVPCVLFVVAAGEGWKPQSTEHLQALDAFGVNSAILVISRSDLADPEPARAEALRHVEGTSLAQAESLCVSSRTGFGLDILRNRLDRLLAAMPVPDPADPVRLWIDRVFTIRGAGTVVTGTLPAGTVALGQALRCEPAGLPAEVRGLQSLQQPAGQVQGISRIAVNLRGADRPALRRGDALVTPGAWTVTDVVDARLRVPATDSLPEQAMLHIGSASIPARIRKLSKEFARIKLLRPLPLHIGDRAILRDPSGHRIIAGLEIADVLPPQLNRRGAASARADELAAGPGVPAPLLRHGLIRADTLQATGLKPEGLLEPVAGWMADPDRWNRLGHRLQEVVAEYLPAHPLDIGMPVQVARRVLQLPDPVLIPPLIAPPLAISGHHIIHTGRTVPLEPQLAKALAEIRRQLDQHPFQAPEAGDLERLGLGRAELAALVRAEVLMHLGSGIYLQPDSESLAVDQLARLPQPFTVSRARQELRTTRRVAVPLLEWLDRRGHTERQADGTRRIRSR